FLGDVMEQLLVRAQVHSPRRILDPFDILTGDFLAGDSGEPGRAPRGHMFARDPAGQFLHPDARHPLSITQCLDDRPGGLLQVPNHAAADTAPLSHADAEHPNSRGPGVSGSLGNHGARLGATEIESGDQGSVFYEVARRTTTNPSNRASSSLYLRPVVAR